MESDLKKIEKEILSCRKCPLFKTRTYPVPGEGNPRAKIVFIGEAPGFSEDRSGRPFCGKSGKILDELLKSAGVRREEVFITSVLKCRPPKNRNPKKEEILACAPYLEKQIEAVKPEMICTLGNYSTAFILEKYGLGKEIKGIGKIHGKIFETETFFGKVRIIPLYHPAVVAYNQNMKKVLLEDFKILST